MPDDPDIIAPPPRGPRSGSRLFGYTARFIEDTLRSFGPPLLWPYASLEATAELFLNASDTVYRGGDVRFGDGKPVVLVPGHLGGDVTLEPLSLWLHAIGYRPMKANVLINLDDRMLDPPLAAALRAAAQRIGRKAVMVAFDTGLRAALRVAAAERDFVSDVIAFGHPDQVPATPGGVTLHIIESAARARLSPDKNVHHVRGSRALLSVNPAALRILAATLRAIPITLLDPPSQA
jgi:hypothetical protein